MTLGGELLIFFGSIFSVAPILKVLFLYLIALGIGLLSKMSFDGIMLLMALATIISGIWLAGNHVMIVLFLIGGGTIIGIAILRLTRH